MDRAISTSRVDYVRESTRGRGRRGENFPFFSQTNFTMTALLSVRGAAEQFYSRGNFLSALSRAAPRW